MRTKILLSALVIGSGIAFAPAVFAQNAAAIGNWPVETDTDSMYHFERMACFQDPQEVNCIGFDNSGMQAPAVTAPAPHRTTHHG